MGYMAYNWYEDTQFRNNPLSLEIQERIKERQTEVLSLIYERYGVEPHIPLIVSDEFHSRLYGVTTLTERKIKIFLNKKRFKESENYMIEEVIPHEYAHAMVMLLGKIRTQDGHTSTWKQICLELDGKFCERYVDNEEIIRQKMGLQ